MRNRIRETRTKVNLTQGELADRVGVARQTINAIENDRSVPTLELALKLCRVLGKRVDEMFRLEGQGDVTAPGRIRTSEA